MDFIKELKSKTSIVELVGEYVRLRKTGSNYVGLCPFHAERTPSFSVSEKKGIFYCFGCHKGGDAITFMQEIHSISFQEAVRQLSLKFKIKLPVEFTKKAPTGIAEDKDEKRNISYKLNRFVAQFYHEQLFSAAGLQALEYLKQRGLTEQSIRKSFMGYAPNGWSNLYDFLVSKKAPIELAEQLGLVRKTDGGSRSYYDLFRNRVLFPVVDLQGRITAFGGRKLDETQEGPKYLNSPESPLFQKNKTLFGLFPALKDIRAEDMVVVVEGYMDCLTLQQAGIGYTVATLGTALSNQHVLLLKRFTKNIVVLFDGDTAGQDAQLRAMETFLEYDIVVRAVALTEGLDPDEYVHKFGVERLLELLKTAPSLLEQKIIELATLAKGKTTSRVEALEKVLPWIAKLQSETSRLVHIEEVASLFDVRPETIRSQVGGLLKQNFRKRFDSIAPTKNKVRVDRLDHIDVKALEYFILYPSYFLKLSSVEEILNGIESDEIRMILKNYVKEGYQASVLLDEIKQKPQIYAIVSRAFLTEQSAIPLEELRALEAKLMRRGLEHNRNILRALIKKTDEIKNTTEFKKLMTDYHDLVRRLNEGGR